MSTILTSMMTAQPPCNLCGTPRVTRMVEDHDCMCSFCRIGRRCRTCEREVSYCPVCDLCPWCEDLHYRGHHHACEVRHHEAAVDEKRRLDGVIVKARVDALAAGAGAIEGAFACHWVVVGNVGARHTMLDIEGLLASEPAVEVLILSMSLHTRWLCRLCGDEVTAKCGGCVEKACAVCGITLSLRKEVAWKDKCDKCFSTGRRPLNRAASISLYAADPAPVTWAEVSAMRTYELLRGVLTR